MSVASAPPRWLGIFAPIALLVLWEFLGRANALPSYLPAPLVIGGGHIVQAGAVLAEGRPEFSAQLSQARMLAQGWSFGPIDGQVAAVLVPGDTVQVSADLLSGVQPLGRLSFAGNATAARISIDRCSAVESLLARLRGPVQLPDLSGSHSPGMRTSQERRCPSSEMSTLPSAMRALPRSLVVR